jgi:hypothetical protein
VLTSQLVLLAVPVEEAPRASLRHVFYRRHGVEVGERVGGGVVDETYGLPLSGHFLFVGNYSTMNNMEYIVRYIELPFPTCRYERYFGQPRTPHFLGPASSLPLNGAMCQPAPGLAPSSQYT